MSRILAVLTTALLCCAGCASSENPARRIEGRRVLVFCGHGAGYVHDNIAASTGMFLELGDEYGFEADSSSDVRCFADSVLQRYDIVAFANASYVDFDSGQREAFRNFIRRGGGFVGVHAAACTGNKWAWFTRMIGGCFDRHPPLQPFVVRTTEAGRKRGTALPDSLTVNDECYLFRLTNPDRNILAVCETRTIDLTPTEEADSLPERVPVVWSLDFEGGRIWYTALGHRPEDYAQPWYRRHILEGLRSVVR